MCGIVGVILKGDQGERFSVEDIIESLEKLEYRGYDSAGIGILLAHSTDRSIKLKKAVGQIKNLRAKFNPQRLQERIVCAIAHTRWATHGGVTEPNTHPHTSIDGNIVLVHNGIIENYAHIKDTYLKDIDFYSQTDTEVVPKLFERFLNEALSTLQNKNTPSYNEIKSLVLSVWGKTLSVLEGSWALAGIVTINLDKGKHRFLVYAKNQSPLVLGIAEEGIFVASDIAALLEYTNSFVFLEDHFLGIADEKGEWGLYRNYKNPVSVAVKITKIDIDAQNISKEPYESYMEKEIHEQPSAIQNTFAYHIDLNTLKPQEALGQAMELITKARQRNLPVTILACGTSYHAGLLGRYYFSRFTNLLPHVFLASEFRYYPYKLPADSVIIAITQSGETADLIQAIKKAKQEGAKVISIVNVPYSTIDRLSDITLYTKSGPEIGVASTKAFTSQLTVLYLLASLLSNSPRELVSKFKQVPNEVDKILTHKTELMSIARQVVNFQHMYYLGRLSEYIVGLEGALKIKEIAYIHAQAHTSAEMKHGPIALVDEKLLSLFIMPKDSVFEKNISNLQEILARKGPAVVITSQDIQEYIKKKFGDKLLGIFAVPTTEEYLYPFLTTIPLQLLALQVAILRGNNVDKPRNLAKSVTVE